MKTNNMSFPYLPLKTVAKYEPLAEQYNVSRVNRGIDKPKTTDIGFLEAYKKYRSEKKLKTILASKNLNWDQVRSNRIKAKYNQLIKQNIPLYVDKNNKIPSKMHTILIMWAFSPDKNLYSVSNK